MYSKVESHLDTINEVNSIENGIKPYALAYALKAVSNWREFGSFGWSRAYDGSLEDPDLWTIVYTKNRDSGLTAQSNAAQIDKALEVYDESTVIGERHSHWACGWIDGYAILVFDSNWHLTPAFLTYAQLQHRLENYPILNEDDQSEREYTATLENIADVIRSSNVWEQIDPDQLDQICHDVFSYFWDNDQSQVENRDDRGGYPDKKATVNALLDLKWILPIDYDPDSVPTYPAGYAEDTCIHWDL
jgi:hypothetical protein